MASSVCNKISLYLPSLSPLTLGGAAIGVGAYLMGAGLPLSILAAGSCYFLKKKEVPKVSDCAIRALKPPAKSSLKIINQNNSCFCSALLWAFLGNEPAVLKELPLAIERRMNAIYGGVLPVDELRSQLYEQQGAGLSQKAKELLSLIELYDLIKESQSSEIMFGDRVNDLRKMAFRVDPSFQGIGVRRGDAHELLQILGSLIFQGSEYEQEFTRPNGTLERSWGNFSIPLQSGSVVNTFFESIAGCRFATPPSILSLALGRNEAGDDYKGMGPGEFLKMVNPTPEFTFPKCYFSKGKDTIYELVGVVRHLPQQRHYDAAWKRGDQWYYGDDLKDSKNLNTVIACPPGEAFKMAETSSLFFYRKK